MPDFKLWENVHHLNFFYEDQCWTSCNGGFCCSNNYPDFSFSFIPQNGTTILYLKHEFEYLKAKGEILDQVYHEISFDFGGPEPLTVYYTTCKLLGLCQGQLTKPLLCKIYPFLPILSEESVVDALPASVFDLTFEAIKVPTPCTVSYKRKNDIIAFFNSESEMKRIFFEPSIRIYLEAARIFARLFQASLESREELKNLKGKDFWKKWEIAYLSGDLLDTKKLKTELFQVYLKLKKKFGEFDY